MKLRYGWLVVALALGTGCGKEERAEAARLSKVLNEKHANFTTADALEKSFVSSARAWCDGIATNGAGKGAALDQNAAVAAELAKNSVAIGAELSQVRQAVDDQSLKTDYTQNVRAALVTQLTKRQRYLQDMRALLEQAGPEFLTYKQSKAYAGDLFPGGIGKLQALLDRYAIPNDDVAAALATLNSKYNFAAGEI